MSNKRITGITRREFLKISAMMGGGLTLSSIVGACTAATPEATAISTAAPTMGPVDLKVYMMSGANTDYWGTVLQTAWNEGNYPFEVKLDITPEENEAWKTAHRTVLAAANPPDISFIFAGQGWAPALVEAGLIADLTPYYDKYNWRDRYSPLFLQDLMVDGQLPQIGLDTPPHPYVYYSKPIFEKLGLEVPANRQPTLDQFVNYIEKSKSADYQPLALGNKDRWPGGHFWSLIANRIMDHDLITQLRWAFRIPTDAKWTDPLPLESMKVVKDWVDNGYFATGLNAMGDGEAQALFVAAKATMYQSGYWGINNISNAAPEMDFDFFHYPALKANKPIAIIAVPGGGVCISSKSKHKDEAAALFDWAIGKEGQKALVEKMGQFPGTNVLAGVEVKWPHPLLAALNDDLATVSWEPFQFENDMPGELKEEGMVALQGVFAGSVTPEEMAERIQKVVDKMIAG
jgi:raffinose/stachyose/melibiose transport system substrate-binding protein